jgi:ABC-2 type transport system permease protein
MWLKSEDALAPLLNTVSVPVLLLSGIMLPMTLAHGWLRALSSANPFRHIVDGARAVFLGDLGDPSVPIALGCSVGLAALGLWVANRTFQRESA